MIPQKATNKHSALNLEYLGELSIYHFLLNLDE
jgi:hypothetical protein